MKATQVNVESSEIAKLPYVTAVPSPPRQVPLLPYYDSDRKQFIIWFAMNGKLVEHKILNVVHGDYISLSPAFPDQDYGMPFKETVYRHFSLPSVTAKCHEASQDLINGLGFIEKYFILLHHHNTYHSSASTKLIAIEMEGAFGNHRSFYDLLHRIIAEIHENASQKKRQMPDSFREVAQKSQQDIVEKYHMPHPLAQFYKNKEPLFMACREIRDHIFHSGASFEMVFALPDGFALDAAAKRFQRIIALVPKLWPEALRKPNNLACVLPLLCLLVEDMFSTMNYLGECLVASFQSPPPPIFEREHIYLRSEFARHLHRLNEYESTHWYSPEIVLKEHIERSSNKGVVLTGDPLRGPPAAHP